MAVLVRAEGWDWLKPGRSAGRVSDRLSS